MNVGYTGAVGAPVVLPSSTPHHRRLSAIALELGVIGSVFLLYRAGRTISRGSGDIALQNSAHVIDFERAVGLFSERSLQQWALQSHTFIELLNRYYVTVHFPLTVAFLIWAYLRHNDAYRLVRTWFVGVTMAALAIHVMFPLAPPRMTSGFVDTLRVFGPRIYTVDPHHSVANQFAAMPSLHFGWAIMLAISVVLIKRSIKSLFVLVHPLLTLMAIVATGNHYWLDAIAVSVLAVIVGAMVLMARARAAEMMLPVTLPTLPNLKDRPTLSTATTRPPSVLATRRPGLAIQPARPAAITPARGGLTPERRLAPVMRRTRGCSRTSSTTGRHPSSGTCQHDRP